MPFLFFADCIVVLCIARSFWASRISGTVNSYEDDIETRYSSVHGGSSASAETSDHRKPNVQSSETKPPPAAFDLESQRAVVAAFGGQEADRSPADVAATHPTGRILPSLVFNEPRHRLLEDVPMSAADPEPLSRAPKRLSARASKRGNQASKSPGNSSLSSDENAALAERSSTKSQRMSNVQSHEGAAATPSDPPRAPSQVVEECRSLTLSAKCRKRTILARYVFGDEDKPGQRWKRRLLRSR
jgi:hypothetical protein